MKMVKGLSVWRAPQEQWRKPNKRFARLIGQKSVVVEPLRAFKGGLVQALEISVTFIYVKLDADYSTYDYEEYTLNFEVIK